MIMTNLYGNIVSNLACGLIGGPGLLSGRNMGPQYAVFEPGNLAWSLFPTTMIKPLFDVRCFWQLTCSSGTRNTGQSIAGKNIANPIAMLNASVDLLDHLGLDYHAQMVGSAVNKTVNDDRIWTPGNHLKNSVFSFTLMFVIVFRSSRPSNKYRCRSECYP